MDQHIQEQGQIFILPNNIQKDQSQIDKSKFSSKINSRQSFEIQQIRISQEEIILKDPSQKALITSIICPICLLTLPLPYYQCEECNNNFCTNCIQDWWRKEAQKRKQPQKQQKSCIFKCENPSFKKVKRSNTYVALLQALQFKCGLCQVNFPLSKYQKHKSKECPEGQILCKNKGCQQVIKRKDQDQHCNSCVFRLQKCKYCTNLFIFKQLSNHEQVQCQQKTVACDHNGCKQLVKIGEYQLHSENCDYKIENCIWCKQQFIKKDFSSHEQKCIHRKYQCSWCHNGFSLQQFQSHICQQRQQTCALCQQKVLVLSFQQHKTDCMFQNMIKLKNQNQVLLEQNVKLHYKINELQQLIQDSLSNAQGKTFQMMKKFKMNQKKQLQKDLLRIQNSMTSINRLRDQQIQKHMNKFKHFFNLGFCPQCRLLQKKFMEMKQPLLKKRREIIEKIQQISKFQETARG